MPAAIDRLRKRSDFVAVRKGRRADSLAFTLQSLPMAGPSASQERAAVGYTATKKIGNAVERNRVRRRLREIVRLAGPDALRGGHRYVLMARREALSLSFDRLLADLKLTAARVHAPRRAKTPPSSSPHLQTTGDSQTDR